MPVNFSVRTRTTTLRTDQDNDGFADAGDILRHLLTLTNSGTIATNVQVSDLLGGSTLTGVVNISPIAFDDNFTAIGNTLLEVGNATSQTGPQSSVAGNILANDVGSASIGAGALASDGVPGFTISAFDATSANGGTVSVVTAGADAGSFTYVSAAGFTGNDSFTYTIRDAGLDGVAGNADDLVSVGTVRVVVTDQVWYIDGSAAVNGNGTSTSPFNSITAFNAANGGAGVDGANDYIHVRGNATGQLTLEAGEQLIGTGSALVVGGFTLAAATGTRSDVTGSSGFTVTLAGTGTGNTIAGIDVNGVGGITGTNFATLTVDNATIDTSGQALSLTTGAFAGTGFVSTDSDGGTNNVFLNGVTGTVNLGGGALSGATGIAFDVNGGNGSVDYNGTVAHSGNALAIEVTNKTGGTVQFDGAVTSNGSSDGVSLVANTGAAVNFLGGLTINTSASNTTAFSASGGGTVAITGAANTISSGTGRAVNIDGATIGGAGITLLSVNAGGGSTTGIFLNNAGSGGFTITGTGSTANSGGTIGSIAGADGSVQAGIGIYINNTGNVSLSNIQMNGTYGNFGIFGQGVTNFTLRDSLLTGSFGNSAGQQEGAVRFGTQSGAGNGLIGTALFEGNTISNGFYNNLGIFNYGAGTLNLTVRDSANDAAVIGVTNAAGNDGIIVETGGTLGSILNLTVDGVAFNGAGGDLLQVIAGGTTNQTLVIQNNQFHNTLTTLGGGVTLSGGGNTANYDVNYLVQNNSFRGAEVSALFVTYAGAAADVSGRILNNTIGIVDGSVSNALASTGSRGGGSGIWVETQRTAGSGTINHAVRIEDNVISDIVSGIGGIYLRSNNATGAGTVRMEATVLDNTITELGNLHYVGIYAIVGGNGGADSGQMGLDIRGNTVNLASFPGGGGQPDGNAISLDQVSTNANYYIPGYSGSPDGEFPIGGPPGTASLDLSSFWTTAPRVNTLQNGEFPNFPGGHVDATIVDDILIGQNFVLPVPLLGPPRPAEDWEAAVRARQRQALEELLGAPASPTVPAGGPAIVDDGVISAAELSLIVEAAIQRWIDAGATEAQVAAMRATEVTVSDLGGLHVGASSPGRIVIDDDAGGFSWFVDPTPLDDSEYVADGGVLRAAEPGTAAAVRIDLLTTLMHELGHQFGLIDLYSPEEGDELMSGYIYPGERRLPGTDDLDGATGVHAGGTAYAIGPLGLGTVPAGRTVTIMWDSVVTGYANQLVPTFNNLSTITGNDGANPFSVTTNTEVLGPAGVGAPVALDSLTLGGTVWLDMGAGGGTANNGVRDGTEAGIDGVAVSLFVDANNDNVADTPGTPLVTGVTSGGGNYSFAGLAPGNYIVRIDSDNFDAGGNVSLVGRATSPGSPDPDLGDPDTDNDDNGFLSGGAVFSNAITLAHDTEPTAGAGNDANTTLDFGFVDLNDAPVNAVPGAQAINEGNARTFSAGLGNRISVSDSDAADASLTVTLAVANGTLTLNGTAGLSFTAGTGTANATMTFSGTQSAINTALDGLVYTPSANFNGADTLTITTNDNGNSGVDPGLTGTATSEQDSDTVTINVADVNDAPTVGGDGTETAPNITAGNPVGRTVSSLFASQFSDAADVQQSGGNPTGSTGDAFGGIAVSGNVAGDPAGEWQFLTGGVWTNIGARSSSNALIVAAADQIRFNPAPGYTGAAPNLTAHLIETGFPVTTGSSIDLVANPPGGTSVISQGTVVLSQNVIASTPAVANDDAFTTNEAPTPLLSGDLFANNGSGADSDAEGDPFSVTGVAGGTVGTQFTLPSGARLTVNANGTFTYDPNGAFNATPTPGSGATNQPASDSFVYTITGGDTATVTITINGLDTDDVLIGSAAADLLLGGNGADYVIGLGGDDTLVGGDGAPNTLQGGVGDDTYIVTAPGDSLVEFANEGADWVRLGLTSYVLRDNFENMIFTGAGPFTGTGNELDNIVIGGAGDDVLIGLGGYDYLIGRGGNDTLIGGSGTPNPLQGGTGDDTYIVSAVGDSLIEFAGEGTDEVRTALASFTLGDHLENLIYIGAGDFAGTGNALDNVIAGGAGNDVLHGLDGRDVLVGGGGNDSLYGGSGAANELIGGAGDDTYYVAASGDSIFELAGGGRDAVVTSFTLYALRDEVEDLFYSGAGDFTGVGTAQANWIEGNVGNDVLNGGLGADTLTGHGGSDRFVFDSALGGGNVDTIRDFAPGTDRILLDDAVFTALGFGALPASAFVTGSSAQDADDRIIYDSATGALYYDADGSGAGAAVQFATLSTGLNLTANDFAVI